MAYRSKTNRKLAAKQGRIKRRVEFNILHPSRLKSRKRRATDLRIQLERGMFEELWGHQSLPFRLEEERGIHFLGHLHSVESICALLKKGERADSILKDAKLQTRKRFTLDW